MTLQETGQTFIVWVKSCTTQPQLDLLKELVDEFVKKRFFNENALSLIGTLTDIGEALEDQSKIITQ